MAKLMNPLLFIIPFIFTFPKLLSRSTTHASKTTVLNVTASIEKTHKVFTFNKDQLRSSPSLSSSSSSFLSLQLHPRTIFHEPAQSNYTYKMLTLARLERDSARVKSLLTQFEGSLKRKVEFEKYQSPVISGTSQGSGEYFTRVGIGNPPSFAYMVLDTGSEISWIQCTPCAYCYQQADPIFQPASSASYVPLSCQSRPCKALNPSECRNNTCHYEISYGDGSYTVGDFVTENITVGSASVSNIAIGCGHNNEGLFVGAAGLLGLGSGSLSLPSQLNASSFSYCLVDIDSNSISTLDFDSPLPLNAITAPLRRNLGLDTFYYVELTGLSVGGELLPIPESSFELDGDGIGGTIMDSGTAVTWLRRKLYDMLRDAFVMNAYGLPPAKSVALFDACYDLSSISSVEVPTVSLHFPEGQELPLAAKNYLIPVDSEGTFCLAFAPTPTSFSIIGNVLQQGTRVGFDLANSLIGFSANNC